jgi:hypothetical protein
MAEHDPLRDLSELARAGEEYAQPLPVERVRQLGQHRRTRRRLAVVAASVVAVLVAGGTVWATSLPRTDNRPDVVASPTPTGSPTPTSGRGPTLGTTSLLPVQQVRDITDDSAVDVSRRGRPVAAMSPCLPDGGWASLGATTVLTRNFESPFEPADPETYPLYQVPFLHTTAAQFAGEQEAGQAVDRIRAWLRDCGTRLQERGYQVRPSAYPDTAFIPVKSGSEVVGEYAVLPHYLPPGFEDQAGSSSDGGFVNEYVGLTRVGDRVAILVTLYVANIQFQADQPDGDPQTGLPANDQFGLVAAAAGRLGGKTPVTEPEATDLGPANLIAVDQLPVVGKERYAETPAGAGRPPKQVTVCRPDSSDSAIGAQDVVSRNFRLATLSDGEPATPEAPIGTDPTVYTQALQFASPAKARQAYDTYRRWLRDCPATLRERGDTPAGKGGEWFPVKAGASTAAGFAELVWRPAGESESGYFESVGLALVDDRLAVTVSLVYGQDYNGVGYSEDGDPQNGLPPHPQYGLVKAAAGRLAR